eukprot:13593468-Alexandrium_andersonii.AAC.1
MQLRDASGCLWATCWVVDCQLGSIRIIQIQTGAVVGAPGPQWICYDLLRSRQLLEETAFVCGT